MPQIQTELLQNTFEMVKRVKFMWYVIYQNKNKMEGMEDYT